MKCKAGEYWN